MSFTIPFTKDSVHEEICGRTMTVGYKGVGQHHVQIKQDIVLLSVPGEKDIKWEVEGGALHLLDERGTSVLHVVNAIEVANGVPFLSGDVMKAEGKKSPMRMVMYEKKALGDDFQIVVSSHVDYEKVTLPLLIRSLAREGIPPERITVVVGGASDEDVPSDEKGYKRVPVTDNLLGCTALAYLLGDVEIATSYLLLMHDTCEVSFGFTNTIGQIDVGLPFDLLQGTFELGLWSKEFIERLRGINGLNLSTISAYKIFEQLNSLCRLSRLANETTPLRSRDVYGSGVKRQVLEYTQLGIKKYLGSDMTGGRP